MPRGWDKQPQGRRTFVNHHLRGGLQLNYSCPSLNKSISEPEPRPLPELYEARGQLLRVFEMEGRFIAVWAWGAISFPSELREKLDGMVGHEVACLRLDNKFHIRDLDAEARGRS